MPPRVGNFLALPDSCLHAKYLQVGTHGNTPTSHLALVRDLVHRCGQCRLSGTSVKPVGHPTKGRRP